MLRTLDCTQRSLCQTTVGRSASIFPKSFPTTIALQVVKRISNIGLLGTTMGYDLPIIN